MMFLKTRPIQKANSRISNSRITKRKNFWSYFRQSYELYIFLLPTMLFFIIFRYWPMYGIQIAFRDYIASQGFFKSPWVGFKHFERFFNSAQFMLILKNTLFLSIYQLAVGFPFPIVFALLLNQVGNKKYKKIVQTVSYAPHFISMVVLVGMLNIFLSPRIGLVNNMLKALGKEPVFFMGEAKWFRTVYVFTGVWQNMGWNAIIYLAALSSIAPELYEAAIVDGANKWQCIRHIEIPGILPTAVILLILNAGRIMNVGFEKVFLMQNSLNLETSEIISTYVYKIGLLNAQFSFSTAVGLFNNLINCILLIIVNKVAKKLSGSGLW